LIGWVVAPAEELLLLAVGAVTFCCPSFAKAYFKLEPSRSVILFPLSNRQPCRFREYRRSYSMNVPFNIPHFSGRELDYIKEAIESKHLSGDGPFSKRCEQWLVDRLGTGKALLTSSGTDALEMAALLADIQPGDEVIMPSFTFVSTANAFVLRGAKPVFIDIRRDTLNLDETKLEAAITEKTKAVVPVHYAGVGCEMDLIGAVTRKHSLFLIEDAAHGVLASYKSKKLGTFGQVSALSFHETKNLIAGEAGALLINDEEFQLRSEILREKGTNRRQFFRGQVDKYTWVDVGSSFLPSELQAAYLWAQMERAEAITAYRMQLWQRYHELLAPLAAEGFLRQPIVPEGCDHNAHLYYILLPSQEVRARLIAYLKERGISAVFHYVPLHSSPAGQRFARTHGSMENTDIVGDTLLRLPLCNDLTTTQIDFVVDSIKAFFAESAPVSVMIANPAKELKTSRP
jgi:dTDP-4-amino-4,6-dideoxygalactose transaminase